MNIEEVIIETRNILNKKYNLNGSFVDYCDIACELCLDLLHNNGIHGTIVKGYVIPVWDKNIKVDHNWIKIGDNIIDPTADQLNIEKFIIKPSDEHYSLYHNY